MQAIFVHIVGGALATGRGALAEGAATLGAGRAALAETAPGSSVGSGVGSDGGGVEHAVTNRAADSEHERRSNSVMKVGED